jgi:hypothetical protein
VDDGSKLASWLASSAKATCFIRRETKTQRQQSWWLLGFINDDSLASEYMRCIPGNGTTTPKHSLARIL